MQLNLNCGGKGFAKYVILLWLTNTGGSNLKLMETATGLPQPILGALLAELMEAKKIKLKGCIFSPR